MRSRTSELAGVELRLALADGPAQAAIVRRTKTARPAEQRRERFMAAKLLVHASEQPREPERRLVAPGIGDFRRSTDPSERDSLSVCATNLSRGRDEKAQRALVPTALMARFPQS